ncbi:MAG: PGPGW domain-containing protein, partial [Microthrixaceae bacterium]
TTHTDDMDVVGHDEDATPPPPRGGAGHPDGHDVAARIRDAAFEAERETGDREETEAEVRRGVIIRLARTVGGFFLIGLGIALLPLPGPGWVTIIVGLGLLPYAWAQRTIRLIRRRIPGVPEDGRIPTRTWVVMGLILAATMTVSILFGDVIGRAIGDAWSSIWS